MTARTLIPTLLLVTATLPSSRECRAQSLRVACYNVNYANRRGDQVLDAIREARADVICFQESTKQSEQFLSDRLRAEYPHFHAVGHQSHFLAERFAFASKLALNDVKYQPPKDGLFGFYSATLTVEDADVRIVNVHLSPFVIPRNAGVAGALAAVSEAETSHASEVEAILDSVNEQIPTIIAGDFNSLSTFVAPVRLTESGFVDSFASLHEEPDTYPTWRWPTRPLPLKLRIDYIFHSGHFRATESEVIMRNGSDHSLPVSRLKLIEETPKEQ